LDPASHVIFGRTLVALDDGRLGRRAAIAAVAGALAPDVDAVLMPVGWDIYLRAHEVGTHSIAGSLPGAIIVGILVHHFATRRRRVAGFRISEEPRISRIAGHPVAPIAAAWIGSLSHLLLDVLSGATIQPGWPLFAGKISVPLFAMADPYAIAIFAGGGLAHAARRRSHRVTAAGVLAATTAFFLIKAALLAAALSAPLPSSHTVTSTQVVEARWGTLHEWQVFDRAAGTLRQWRVDVAGRQTLLFERPVPPTESGLVHDSRRLTTVRNFLAVHDLNFAVEVANPEGTQVLWSDIRFCRADRRGQANLTPIDCALWFGGLFDRRGQVIRELVKVGGWLQTRAPAR